MPAATLARLVLLEARRGALPWLCLGCIALAVALAAFLSQVAVSESLMLQAALVAALLRAGAVFLIAAQVAGSILREMNDKALEMSLTLPVSRLAQYVGRLAGFAACSAGIAALFSVPLLFWAPPATVALWGLSLALECTLVAAATMFFAMVLGQLVPTIASVAGLYLLGRSMAAIQEIASGPLADTSLAQDIARGAVDATAFLLPRLDVVTRTEWLLYGPPEPQAYLGALAGLLVYAALLVAAGLFDFHRKNL
jgi:ABC-type transport system involved in multi-copper enzyme maturation permease subunit